jgi:hypothetical protein
VYFYIYIFLGIRANRKIQCKAFSIFFFEPLSNVARNYILGDQVAASWCETCASNDQWEFAENTCMVCGVPLCGACSYEDAPVCVNCKQMTDQDDSLDLRLCRKCGKMAYMRKDGCINTHCVLYFMNKVGWRPQQRGASSSDWRPQDFEAFAQQEDFAGKRTRNKGRKRKVWWANRCAGMRPGSNAAWRAGAPMQVNSSDEEDVDWPTDADAGDPMNRAPITPPAAHAQQGPRPAANQAPPPTVDQEDC